MHIINHVMLCVALPFTLCSKPQACLQSHGLMLRASAQTTLRVRYSPVSCIEGSGIGMHSAKADDGEAARESDEVVEAPGTLFVAQLDGRLGSLGGGRLGSSLRSRSGAATVVVAHLGFSPVAARWH